MKSFFENFLTYLVSFLTAMVIISLFALLLGLPVMLLWNWTLPSLFGIARITFWKAVGVNLLCGFLFRGLTTVKQ